MSQSSEGLPHGDAYERTLAWIAIQQLVADFAESVDKGNGVETAELFTEDGWYESPSGRSQGREAIRRAYRVRAARGARTARHIFTNLRIQRVSRDVYSGTSLLLVFAEEGLPPRPARSPLVADVTDTYLLSGSTALLRSRSLEVIFAEPEHKFALPLGGAEDAG